MSEQDQTSIKALLFAREARIPRNGFNLLRSYFPELDIRSHYKCLTRLEKLSDLPTVDYDCCIKGCCCYTGEYAQDDGCIFCGEPRRNASGKPRQKFTYIKIGARLAAMLSDPDLSKSLRYHYNYDCSSLVVRDVFDSEHYRELCREEVIVDGQKTGRAFFSNPQDFALGLSTDGFQLFKRGNYDAWPLILVNYNLPPEVRSLMDNILILGVIPGPHQPKDIDSYLHGFIEEMVELARDGYRTWDSVEGTGVTFHAYCILYFGDMPAIAKLMNMLGHNGRCPCRACLVKGILGPKNHYYPVLQPPERATAGADAEAHPRPPNDPRNLRMREHQEHLAFAERINTSMNQTARERDSRLCGIRGTSCLARLPGTDFPRSFALGYMHVFLENIIPTMVKHWTDTFKFGGEYVLPQDTWNEIGDIMKSATSTIPSQFGRGLPHIGTNRTWYTAEAWSQAWLYYFPIVLKGRFPNQGYYDHFMNLREIMLRLTDYSLDRQELEGEITDGIIEWVEQYEE